MLWAAVQRLTREQLGDAIAAMCMALQTQACNPAWLPSLLDSCTTALCAGLRVLPGFAMARFASCIMTGRSSEAGASRGAAQDSWMPPDSCVTVDVPCFEDGMLRLRRESSRRHVKRR